MRRFAYESQTRLSEKLQNLFTQYDEEITEQAINEYSEIAKYYEDFKESIRNGAFGKTATFRMLYLDLVRAQHYIHVAVEENNLPLKLFAWEYFLPLLHHK